MALKEMDQFIEIIDRIKDLINWYENTKFKNKKMRLFLTNKECFLYSLPEDKVAHLLGVNINSIQALGMFKSTSSYSLLKEFVRDYHRICDRIKNGTLKLDTLFSKHIYKKLDNFKKNVSINLNDISFICVYDKKKAYNDGKETIKADYVIIKKLDDGTILELDLVLSNNNLYPVSNKMYTNEFEAEEDLKRILENQEIAIVNSMMLYNNEYDNPRKFFLNDDEKIEKLSLVKEFIQKYGCTIDLVSECEYLYKNTKTHREKSSDNYDIYETIIDCVINGKLIPTNSLTNITQQQYDLIDAINDSIIRNNVGDSENLESYSSLRKAVENLRSAKRELTDENKRLNNVLQEKQAEINELKEDNELNKRFISNITNSFNDYNNEIEKRKK